MNSFEANEVYYSFQGQAVDDHMADMDDENKMPKEAALVRFIKFIREWKQDNKFIYRYARKILQTFLLFL